MSKNSYRKSVVLSVVSIVISAAMLIGVTYATFTDTAETGVNEIVAGNLNITLLDANNNSLEGESVGFVVPEGKTAYWEPGISYTLEPVTIKNEGNLDLKYKIEVSGIDGSTGLNDKISWSVKVNGGSESINLNNYEGHLRAAESQGANSVSDTLVLEGTFDDDADNSFMNARLSGINIRVLATQDLSTASYPS